MKGRIHSVESMGLLDGPGVRYVVFLQGCRLRCAYCHNPDTWSLKDGQEIEAAELLRTIKRYLPYFQASGGGVTFSGGEPLLQPDFLLEMLKLCKDAGIHTALDTAGVGRGRYKEILEFTDLVIFDVKHVTPQGYKELTGMEISAVEQFLRELAQSAVPVWVRHVVVPGITDSKEHILSVKKYIQQLPQVVKFELLPYHRLGESKYDGLGIKYQLAGLNPPAASEFSILENYAAACL